MNAPASSASSGTDYTVLLFVPYSAV